MFSSYFTCLLLDSKMDKMKKEIIECVLEIFLVNAIDFRSWSIKKKFRNKIQLKRFRGVEKRYEQVFLLSFSFLLEFLDIKREKRVFLILTYFYASIFF